MSALLQLHLHSQLKGVLINSEKFCDSAHSRCSYLLFPTAGAISRSPVTQISLNRNFVSHGAEIWLCNRHFGHVDPVLGLPPLNPGAFPLLMLILAQHLFSQPQGCQQGHPGALLQPPSSQCRHSSIIPKIAHLQVANKPHIHTHTALNCGLLWWYCRNNNKTLVLGIISVIRYRVFIKIQQYIPQFKKKNVCWFWSSCDALWQNKYRSTLDQPIACCLMASSHKLNQWWPIHLQSLQYILLKILKILL